MWPQRRSQYNYIINTHGFSPSVIHGSTACRAWFTVVNICLLFGKHDNTEHAKLNFMITIQTGSGGFVIADYPLWPEYKQPGLQSISCLWVYRLQSMVYRGEVFCSIKMPLLNLQNRTSSLQYKQGCGWGHSRSTKPTVSNDVWTISSLQGWTSPSITDNLRMQRHVLQRPRMY